MKNASSVQGSSRRRTTNAKMIFKVVKFYEDGGGLFEAVHLSMWGNFAYASAGCVRGRAFHKAFGKYLPSLCISDSSRHPCSRFPSKKRERRMRKWGRGRCCHVRGCCANYLTLWLMDEVFRWKSVCFKENIKICSTTLMVMFCPL